MYITIIINILLCSSRSYSVTSVSYAVCALFCFDLFVFGICFVFRSLPRMSYSVSLVSTSLMFLTMVLMFLTLLFNSLIILIVM